MAFSCGAPTWPPHETFLEAPLLAEQKRAFKNRKLVVESVFVLVAWLVCVSSGIGCVGGVCVGQGRLQVC